MHSSGLTRIAVRLYGKIISALLLNLGLEDISRFVYVWKKQLCSSVTFTTDRAYIRSSTPDQKHLLLST